MLKLEYHMMTKEQVIHLMWILKVPWVSGCPTWLKHFQHWDDEADPRAPPSPTDFSPPLNEVERLGRSPDCDESRYINLVIVWLHVCVCFVTWKFVWHISHIHCLKWQICRINQVSNFFQCSPPFLYVWLIINNNNNNNGFTYWNVYMM